jgi:hypothetical protein
MLQSDGWYARMLNNLGARKMENSDAMDRSIAEVKTESFVKPVQANAAAAIATASLRA